MTATLVRCMNDYFLNMFVHDLSGKHSEMQILMDSLNKSSCIERLLFRRFDECCQLSNTCSQFLLLVLISCSITATR